MNRDREHAWKSRVDQLMMAPSNSQDGPTQAPHGPEEPPSGNLARQPRNYTSTWRTFARTTGPVRRPPPAAPLSRLPRGSEGQGHSFPSQPDPRLRALRNGDDGDPWKPTGAGARG